MLALWWTGEQSRVHTESNPVVAGIGSSAPTNPSEQVGKSGWMVGFILCFCLKHWNYEGCSSKEMTSILTPACSISIKHYEPFLWTDKPFFFFGKTYSKCNFLSWTIQTFPHKHDSKLGFFFFYFYSLPVDLWENPLASNRIVVPFFNILQNCSCVKLNAGLKKRVVCHCPALFLTISAATIQ